VSDATTAPSSSDRLDLPGPDQVSVPPLGVGTWAWGDKGTWGMGGYDASLTESSIRDAWDACIEAGVVLFDTAEVYGKGESERIIGRLLAEDAANNKAVRDKVVIATKFMPSPWKVNVKTALVDAARHSIDRLGIETIDLYQIHGPISLRGHDAIAEALAAAHEQKLVKAVGVSNYSPKETESVDAALRRQGLRLATNQIEFSLLRTMPIRSGLIDTCRNLGVVPLAYSPIGQGRLTGKYTAANPPPGRRTFGDHPMAEVDRIVDELRRIGEDNNARTPSQVALAWLIAKGAVPIPGAKNRVQAQDNAGALGWRMSDDDVAALDRAALHGKRGIAQRVWQHG
jgi:aryl-alcohol dehydrogenase-like predicted oxidoreductase